MDCFLTSSHYAAPEATILEVLFEGIICDSGVKSRTYYDIDDSNPFAGE